VDPICVSDKRGNLTMFGTGASGSFLDTAQSGQPMSKHDPVKNYKDILPKFEVPCITFMDYVTEGAEWFVLAGLLPHFRALPERPTMHISLHNTIARESEDRLQAVGDFLKLFKYGTVLSDKMELPLPLNTLDRATLEGPCLVSCSVAVSDVPPQKDTG